MTELNLCRLYRCTPTELDRQDWLRVRAHIVVLEAEADYDSLQST